MVQSVILFSFNSCPVHLSILVRSKPPTELTPKYDKMRLDNCGIVVSLDRTKRLTINYEMLTNQTKSKFTSFSIDRYYRKFKSQPNIAFIKCLGFLIYLIKIQ